MFETLWIAEVRKEFPKDLPKGGLSGYGAKANADSCSTNMRGVRIFRFSCPADGRRAGRKSKSHRLLPRHSPD